MKAKKKRKFNKKMSRRQKKECDDKKEKKEDYFHKLKVKYLNVKELCAKKIQTKTLDATDANITNLKTENANITNLIVTKINGNDVNCNGQFNISGVITPVVYNNGKPAEPTDPLNQLLHDMWLFNLVAKGFTNLDAASGRSRNLILNKFYGCEPCPPYDTTSCDCPTPGYAQFQGSVSNDGVVNILSVDSIDNVSLTNCPAVMGTIEIGQNVFSKNSQVLVLKIVSQVASNKYIVENSIKQLITLPTQTFLSLSNLTLNDCINVPLTIYGVESVPLSQVNGNCRNIVSAISYNLNIANRTLTTRVAAVYVQVGYIDQDRNTVIKGIEIDTRQFDPSILSFGEQMNNNVLLPSNLINTANFFNGFVQLVVYVEDGADVLIPNSSLNSARQARAAQSTTPPTTNYAAAYVNNPGNLTTPGTYPIPKDTSGLYIFGGGGGGGSGGGSIAGGGGGGGGSGNSFQALITDYPNAVSFVLTRVGSGGVGGSPGGNNGQDGGLTTGYFIDANSNQVGSTISVLGGTGGKTTFTGTGGGNGGNGGGGGGGGGGSQSAKPGLGGQGIAGGNGQNGQGKDGGYGGFNEVGFPIPGGKGGVGPGGDTGGGGGGGPGVTALSHIQSSSVGQGGDGQIGDENGRTPAGNGSDNLILSGGGGGGGGSSIASGPPGSNGGKGGSGASGFIFFIAPF